MKSVFKFISGVFGFAVLTACSSEEVIAPVADNAEGDFYTAVAINFATGTLSATDQPDDGYSSSDSKTEVGQDNENKVNSVVIVLATTDDEPKVLAWKHVTPSENPKTGSTGNTPTNPNESVYTASFQSSELEKMAGTPFQPIVFCNPTNTLLKLLDTKNDESNTVVNLAKLQYTLQNEDDDYAWTNNAFLMSNAKTYTTQDYKIPTTEEFPIYNSGNPYKLGVVDVERAAVRFDLKRAGTFKNGDNTVENDAYAVENDKNAIAHLKLVKVGLFNMSKSFYYLRRVSADGTDKDWKIGMPELPWMSNDAVTQGNYVVDTDWNLKNSYSYGNSNIASNFLYSYENVFKNSLNILDESSKISWKNVDDIWGNSEDKDDEWNTGDNHKDTYDGYHIWRYATENTIPGVKNQKVGISTGVYFCTQIIPNEENGDLDSDMKGGKKLYVFEDKLYGSWERVETAANNTPGSTLASAVASAKEKITDDKKTVEEANTSEDLEKLGFTAYSPYSDGNYYVYYVYKNRHNDNHNNGVMQAMEFATVRNNVYKLSLSSIKVWGHPTDPKDPDPDPENPDDPDESEKVYFTVTARVLPWVVRVNNVQF